MKVLLTDHDFPDVDLELALYRDAGVEVAAAQCRTEADVIAAGRGCQGLLSQYAPLNAKVFEALPEVRVVSRMGAGFDTVNVEDAKRFGVWVANSPDYGVGGVATYARHGDRVVAPHSFLRSRRRRARRYTSAGPLRRPG